MLLFIGIVSGFNSMHFAESTGSRFSLGSLVKNFVGGVMSPVFFCQSCKFSQKAARRYYIVNRVVSSLAIIGTLALITSVTISAEGEGFNRYSKESSESFRIPPEASTKSLDLDCSNICTNNTTQLFA